MTTEWEVRISRQLLDECRVQGVAPLVPMHKDHDSPEFLRWLWKPSFLLDAKTVQPATPRQVIEFLRIGRAVVGGSANKWASTAVGQYRWWTVRLLD